MFRIHLIVPHTVRQAYDEAYKDCTPLSMHFVFLNCYSSAPRFERLRSGHFSGQSIRVSRAQPYTTTLPTTFPTQKCLPIIRQHVQAMVRLQCTH